MPLHSQSPLALTHGLPLALVLVKTVSGPDGAVREVGYWNHAAEGWDEVFDPPKHARPFSRVGPAPGAGAHQAIGLPPAPLYDPAVLGLIYSLDNDGNLASAIESVTWNQLAFVAGIL